MNPLKRMDIKGNWVTIQLHFKDDESIDFIRLGSELDKLMAVNPDGIYCHGTAGEFYNITESEFDQITELIAYKCNASPVMLASG